MRTQILIITLMTLFGSSLGFLANVVMARKYGLSEQYDFYLYSLSTPVFLATIVSSVLNYSVVPRFILNDRYDEKTKKNQLITLASILSLPFLVISFFPGIFLTHNFESLQSSNFNQKSLISIAWLIGFVQVNLASFNTILNAKKNYYYSSVISYLPYLGVILFVSLDFYLSIGVALPLIGMLFGLVFSILVIVKKLDIKLRQLFDNKSLNVLHLINSPSNFIATIFAMNIFSMYSVIDAFIAPSFGEGYLSMLGYSQRLLIGFGNIAVIGLLTIMGPVFSETYKAGGEKALYEEVKKVFILLFIATMVLTILLFTSIETLIGVIFGHNQIDHHHKFLLIKLNHFMLPGMVAMLISAVLLKAMMILKNITYSLVFMGLGWPVIYFSIILLNRNWGIVSFGVGYSVAWIYILIVIVLTIYRNLIFKKNE